MGCGCVDGRAKAFALARVVCLVGIAYALCGCNGPIHLRVQEHVATPNPRVVMFFIDGMNRSHYRKWLAEGSLPNIKRYLVDRGTEVENAVSCLPSITYANMAAMLTGRRPGHHGVISNKWFDRQRLFYEDCTYGETYRRINNDVRGKTLYEMLSDKFTVSIQCPLTRGVDRTYYNDITASITWWLGLLDWTDRLMPLRFEEIALEASAKPDGTWPSFIHSYFPAVDEYGHLYGTRGWPYKYAVQNADHQIGRICGGLEAAGLLEKTTLLLLADHGMVHVEPGQKFYVHRALRDRFEKVVPHTWPEFVTDYELRRAHLERYDTIVTPDGGRKCSVYFRFDDHWRDRPANVEVARTCTLERHKVRSILHPGPSVRKVARWLASQEAVVVAAVPIGPDSVAIYGRVGEAVIDRRGTGRRATYRYRIRRGGDPLGYVFDPQASRLIDDQYHSANAWFDATLKTDAPDFPGQICEVFDTSRAGDIMLFAARGWAFSWKERGGHGSITADDMFVPMVWAGPGIAVGGKVERARTCDVMPTILDVLGELDRLERHEPIDGRSLLPELRARRVARTR